MSGFCCVWGGVIVYGWGWRSVVCVVVDGGLVVNVEEMNDDDVDVDVGEKVFVVVWWNGMLNELLFEVLIEFWGVKKVFGEKVVLDGVSFKVWWGEVVGIIGLSGIGKFIVLCIMVGLLILDEGEVYIRGKRRKGLASDEAYLELYVGMVF